MYSISELVHGTDRYKDTFVTSKNNKNNTLLYIP